MRKSPKFSPETRERAVRMVFEHRAEHPSQWAAIESIAAKIGCVPQTLNTWVRTAKGCVQPVGGLKRAQFGLSRRPGRAAELLPAVRTGDVKQAVHRDSESPVALWTMNDGTFRWFRCSR